MTTHAAPPFDLWLWMQLYAQTWSATLDPQGLGHRHRDARLSRVMECAQRESPLYRRRSGRARCLSDFEPVTRLELMRHFDDWSTDRRITRDAAEAFVADPSRVADAWLGRYLLWTSSGTSGHPGLFVQDAASLAAYDAIDALRLRGANVGQPALGLWSLGRRFAFVGAVGGHFAGHVNLERLRRIVPPAMAPAMHVVSVLEPLQHVAETLQALQPNVLITYPSAAAALAQLQAQGMLHLALTELWLGGEQFSAPQRQLLRSSFGCTVRNAYGASEFMSIAFECPQGQLHLNDDWVVLEPVDARLRPMPPGELSDHTLLTNLANRTQPLLRYVLEDRTRFVTAACACGSGFPVIEVQGRADDTLILTGASGRPVTILPLALETAIEEGAGVTHFQVLRRGTCTLELRLEASVSHARAAAARCRHVMAEYLTHHGVAQARIVFSEQEPMRQRGSGKLRRVIGAPLRE